SAAFDLIAERRKLFGCRGSHEQSSPNVMKNVAGEANDAEAFGVLALFLINFGSSIPEIASKAAQSGIELIFRLQKLGRITNANREYPPPRLDQPVNGPMEPLKSVEWLSE